jgi:hypothetical protein
MCVEVPLLVAISSTVHGSKEGMGTECCQTGTEVPLLVATSSTVHGSEERIGLDVA